MRLAVGKQPQRPHLTPSATVDARGLRCPTPLVMAKLRMEKLAGGERLPVLATDPEAAIDLAAWASEEGHDLREHPGESWTEFLLRKRR